MAEAVTAAHPNSLDPEYCGRSGAICRSLHWEVAPASIAHLYPAGIEPDVFDGRSYVGLVPFHMDTGLAHGPVLVRRFLETNVRLYSVDGTGDAAWHS